MLRLVLAALLLTGAMAVVTRPRPDGLAPPSPGTAVIFGGARITLLTENLFRFEYSASGVFDDRATLTVINRQMPVPSYKTSNPSPQSVSIDIGDVVITYTTPAKPPPARSIGVSAAGRDALSAVRSALYPNGLYAGSYQECGNYCLVDGTCSAFVWDTTATDPTNCWPLCAMAGNYSNSARVLTLIANSTNGTCTAPPSPFSGNLQITSTNPTAPFKWRPGQAPTGNLLGTYSSLDCYSNPTTCYTQYMSALNTSYGLLSTQGWSVVDDTATMRFTPPPAGAEYPNMTWWTQASMVDAADFYFLAHGLNFKLALAEFAAISGAIGLPPRAAFGPWWSRYWPYTAQTIVSEVLSGYANYSIPLTTLVLDMDWHNEPTTGGCQSWGNYDWNLSYFPDPVGFSEWVHSPDNIVGYPLKMALNVHPQTGVDHCDLRYSQIATKMGVNPATNQTVQCNFANVTFTQAVFDVYFDASPLRLNDVWWTDYGGCGGANPLLWSNYVFDSYPGSLQSNRPLVLSRNGGLGGQRYPIGFSGDTFQHEITLDFEIQTTPMAANVLFAYWSHDIGGFHNGSGCPGDADPTNYTGSELLLRWVQFGAVAPIMRTHCDHCERRIWMFYSHFPEMLDAFRLRNALMPYLYTEAYAAYQNGLAPVRSMYIEWPTEAGAYTANHQFYVGSQIIAAPISNILPEGVNTTTEAVWIPPGVWVSWDNTVVNAQSTLRTDTYTLAQIPLWVPQWTILPLKGPAVSDFQSTQPAIMWTLWPGANTAGLQPMYKLFEDDGVSLAYQTGGGASTVASYTGGLNATIVLTVGATTGKYNGQLPTRTHYVQVRGYGPTPPAGVVVNGALLPATSYYVIPASSTSLVEAPLALYVNAGTYPINKPVTITISRTEV